MAFNSFDSWWALNGLRYSKQQPQPAMRFRNMKAYRTAGECGARCSKG